MKILQVVNLNGNNTYIENLVKVLSKNETVFCNVQSFWSKSLDVDIIHIHWPELLSYRLLTKQLSPNNLRLKKIENQLIFWKKKKIPIVITRHDEDSHWLKSPNKKLFQLVYQYVDGIIHLGNKGSELYDVTKQKQTIIPHGLYNNLVNNTSKKEARKYLGLNQDEHVFLAFGIIRYPEEEAFISKAFNLLPFQNKKIIFPNGYFKSRSIAIQIARKLNLNIYKNKIKSIQKEKLRKGIIWSHHFIPIAEIQFFFNAADVIVIPRLRILNSGNLFMGFTFKKVVVGPDCGNVGAILKKTGNPVFNPRSIETAKKAMLEGLKLSKSAHGKKNYVYGNTNWSWKDIGQAHINFYSKLLNSK